MNKLRMLSIKKHKTMIQIIEYLIDTLSQPQNNL
jgi:hypothetical protein